MFQPIAPFRNSDTRGFGGAGVAPIAHRFGLNPAVFPANTVAIALNAAVVNPAAPGFCTVWTAGPRPDTSFINFPAGGAWNGAIVVGIQDMAFFIQANVTAHLIADITGFWTP